MPERILFLTGRLAETNLQRILESLDDKAFTYEIRQLGVSVAALMTSEMIKRRLQNVENFDRMLLPGLCAFDPDDLSEHFQIPVDRGPKELKDLPEYFGSTNRKISLDNYSASIFAEIVDAPNMSVEAIVEAAYAFRRAGADVIDVGTLPEVEFTHLKESIETLKTEDFAVSIDSLNSAELLTGAHAGADYLLSLTESTLWICDETDSIPILIPDEEYGIPSLYRAIDALLEQGNAFMADSILTPIHFGFTQSIVQYHELRAKYPQIDIMVGIGNLTELTDADTTGMTALLMGIVSEIDAKAVLTTQVSKHAHTVIRETDLARRMMYAAKSDASIPKGFDESLITLHEKKPFADSDEEIRELAEMIKDPSFRIRVGEEGIYIFNRAGLFVSTNPFDLFPNLNVEEDGSHAFYLGAELTKAQIAWHLGKRYLQDRDLSWGGILPEDLPANEYDKPVSTEMKKGRNDES